MYVQPKKDYPVDITVRMGSLSLIVCAFSKTPQGQNFPGTVCTLEENIRGFAAWKISRGETFALFPTISSSSLDIVSIPLPSSVSSSFLTSIYCHSAITILPYGQHLFPSPRRHLPFSSPLLLPPVHHHITIIPVLLPAFPSPTRDRNTNALTFRWDLVTIIINPTTLKDATCSL